MKKEKALRQQIQNLENKVIGYWAFAKCDFKKEIIFLKNNKILSSIFLDLRCFMIIKQNIQQVFKKYTMPE